jgi:arginine:agmatine antiporter
VPVRDLLVLGLLMTLIAFATAAPTIGERFGVLINVATNLSLAVYGLCCIALFRFAGALERHRMTARVVAVLGLAFSVWTIAVGDPEMLKVQGVLLVASLPAWALVWWAGRAMAAPASAQ